MTTVESAMPKIGMQPIRSHALVEAVIAEIGEAGSMDVTVSQIARRAGMSPALAHHYFGSKNSMFVAAMRHIMTQFGQEVRARLAGQTDPRRRLEIIIHASFSETSFRPENVSAWLNFYVFANKSGEVARLLHVYHRRLHSNLVHELKRIGVTDSESAAEGIATMIDGAYVRWAIARDGLTGLRPEALVLDYLSLCLDCPERPA